MEQVENIELIVGGYVCTEWDSISIDSDLQIPADSWSLTLFNPDAGTLPVQVQAGQTVTLYYNGQLVLKGVLDRIQESVSRSGRRFVLSGRDLAALLLDNSIRLYIQQEISIFKAAGSYFLSDPIAAFFNQGVKIDFPRVAELVERIVAVEPSESMWQFLSKAAEVMGQYIWVDPIGDIYIGDPFTQHHPTPPILRLNRDDQSNNVLAVEYVEDATELYSEVIVLGQDANTQKSLYANAVGQTTSTPRRKVVMDNLADTSEKAAYRAKKIIQDGQISAYTLLVTVAGWICPTDQVWATGWTVNFESDVMSARVSGEWVIMARTLELSRANGKTTLLQLKRKP